MRACQIMTAVHTGPTRFCAMPGWARALLFRYFLQLYFIPKVMLSPEQHYYMLQRAHQGGGREGRGRKVAGRVLHNPETGDVRILDWHEGQRKLQWLQHQLWLQQNDLPRPGTSTWCILG